MPWNDDIDFEAKKQKKLFQINSFVYAKQNLWVCCHKHRINQNVFRFLEWNRCVCTWGVSSFLSTTLYINRECDVSWNKMLLDVCRQISVNVIAAIMISIFIRYSVVFSLKSSFQLDLKENGLDFRMFDCIFTVKRKKKQWYKLKCQMIRNQLLTYRKLYIEI